MVRKPTDSKAPRSPRVELDLSDVDHRVGSPSAAGNCGIRAARPTSAAG